MRETDLCASKEITIYIPLNRRDITDTEQVSAEQVITIHITTTDTDDNYFKTL